MTYYFVQSKDEAGNVCTVGHSEDEETKEVYYKHINRKDAVKLLNDEQKTSPEYQYRLVKVIERIEVGKWEPKLITSEQVNDKMK